MRRDFANLRRKLLMRILAIAAVSVVLWAAIQLVLVQGVLQPPVVEVPQGEFATDALDGDVVMFDEAQIHTLEKMLNDRQNILLATIGVLVLLLVAVYYVMMRMMRYFREASDGVDQLLDEGGSDIALSPEMDFLQDKLNGVKAELARRSDVARDAERRKNELVAYLAHDIRTPLTSVIGYLNLLIESPDRDAAKRARDLGIALESAKRLESLVNQLFEITRFHAQGMVLARHSIDMTMLLQQVVESFEPMLAAQGRRVVLEAPNRLCIDADADKLARVFANILKNALAYGDAGTDIVVRVAQADGEVVTTISNTGEGIPQGALTEVFDAFYRGDDARSARTGGAGLGLAIAKEIVLAHGGRIEARCAGRETAFVLALPL